MLITQNHIKSIIYTKEEAKKLGLPVNKETNYHGLGKDGLIKVIDSLDEPSEIYKKSDNEFIVITNITDNNDKVIVPIKINGTGTYNNVYIDENQILSAYGKTNLNDYLDKNNFEMIYPTKKETTLNERDQSSNISDFFDNSISQNEENASEIDNVNPTDNEDIS